MEKNLVLDYVSPLLNWPVLDSVVPLYFTIYENKIYVHIVSAPSFDSNLYLEAIELL